MSRPSKNLRRNSRILVRALSGLEQGKRNPTVITLFELAEAIGVSHLDLLAPHD
ncbi:XRE family transcriptional regulator [Mesorhizobium sp. M8A.F.Ca.ET.208.01.1.1]|nr:XRE family transcriptional regulator [Mesorhizobium sp. M8A.F.Ca.ET.208.01.1.1]TGT51118.1 XRE family transcriptional regulator [Mesorhizobium sp. M8A.F.Ca.ET.167.01.1.1]